MTFKEELQALTDENNGKNKSIKELQEELIEAANHGWDEVEVELNHYQREWLDEQKIDYEELDYANDKYKITWN